MTDASGPAHGSLTDSLAFQNKRIECKSIIATNIVESLPGVWGKGWGEWLFYELEGVLVIVGR